MMKFKQSVIFLIVRCFTIYKRWQRRRGGKVRKIHHNRLRYTLSIQAHSTLKSQRREAGSIIILAINCVKTKQQFLKCTQRYLKASKIIYKRLIWQNNIQKSRLVLLANKWDKLLNRIKTCSTETNDAEGAMLYEKLKQIPTDLKIIVLRKYLNLCYQFYSISFFQWRVANA